MTRSADDLPHFPLESDRAPLGIAAKRLMPTPSASVRSLPDPDTLSSDSTDSLREQLHLVNQRIDNVRKTLKTNDERGESPLRVSPFIQEIQDAPIPPHFCLPMLEAYDDNSDPMKHIATFHPSLHPKGLVERQVDVIVGGPTAGGVSSSTRKAYARAEVLKRLRTRGDPGITFESESEYLDHDDALMVTTRIANAHVRHIMISTGSSIPRLENSTADALAQSASIDTVDELLTIPSLYRPMVAIFETATMVAHPDWREEMLHYKRDATLPADKAVARQIKKIEAWNENFTTEASEAGLRENLNMLEERMAKAHLKTLHYQRAIARLYNRRIRTRPVSTGDMVLRRAEVSDSGCTRGKLTPRWEGPYRITPSCLRQELHY
ncbi:hypothetical protein BHE74_00047721 [Ensete ventricosum]|nr:hypothetical protein BHE74_00047721 [Ensete ventricosum]